MWAKEQDLRASTDSLMWLSWLCLTEWLKWPQVHKSLLTFLAPGPLLWESSVGWTSICPGCTRLINHTGELMFKPVLLSPLQEVRCCMRLSLVCNCLCILNLHCTFFWSYEDILSFYHIVRRVFNGCVLRKKDWLIKSQEYFDTVQ